MCRHVFGVIAAVALITGCGQEERVSEPIRPVKAAKLVDPSDLPMNVFSGQAEPFHEADLGFEMAGTIVELPVDKGDTVTKGQLLAKIDQRGFSSELNAAQAELDRAVAHRDRIAEALKLNAVAAQDLTDAEAKVSQAKANVEIKEKALEDSVISAPYDGVIAWRYKNNFQRVNAKENVVRILDISKIKFTISLPESMISYAPYVEEVMLEFDPFPGRKIPAQVKEIGRQAMTATRTYPVTLVFEQPKDFTVLPGMAGRTVGGKMKPGIDLSKKTFTVPAGALFSSADGKDYVWLIDEKTNTVEKHEVVIVETRAKGIELKGLKKGDLVVTGGVHHLEEGQKVKVLTKETL